MEYKQPPLKEMLKSLIAALDKDLTKIDDNAVQAPFHAFGGIDFRVAFRNSQTKMLDYSFYSDSDFYSRLSLEKRFKVYDTMKVAILLMLMKNGMGCPVMIPADNSQYPKVTIYPLPEQETTLFLLTDSFKRAQEILNPCVPTKFEESTTASNNPSNDAIILAYNYIKYRSKHPVFIFLEDNLNFSGQPYSAEGKTAFKLHLSNTLEAIGIYDNLASLEITTYDIYAKTVCPEKTVDFFLSRLKDCAQSHILTMYNIGTALQSRKQQVIDSYVSASNLSVRTRYHYASTPNSPHAELSNIAPFQNPSFKKLFDDLSIAATTNLKFLHSDRIFSAMVTSEWLYSNFGQVQGLDNTFICAGYFKFVELLLTEILISDYKGSYIYLPKGPQAIDDNEKWLMLGNMFQFISYDKNSPISNSPHQALMCEAFENWTKHIRNGYFHKHILSAEEVTNIRNKTFEVVYMILGVLPK